MAKVQVKKTVSKVVRASEIKFRFEHKMTSSVLGVRRSVRVFATSGKSASGIHPASK